MTAEPPDRTHQPPRSHDGPHILLKARPAELTALPEHDPAEEKSHHC
ncbi:hypothetical protein [Pseudonocardia parietis]|uniref:Uncharacterized protein n=1 Tax=Pseudonocardia parietis TaxID=570936 RepID=A0ABS4VS55_9PSEU|nr:hypothetical protein [Pseudonocardia parietis]MBP2366763.1 hypothetical protein [Pseudonocardia parietis]